MKDGVIVFIGTGSMSLSAAHMVRAGDDRRGSKLLKMSKVTESLKILYWLN